MRQRGGLTADGRCAPSPKTVSFLVKASHQSSAPSVPRPTEKVALFRGVASSPLGAKTVAVHSEPVGSGEQAAISRPLTSFRGPQ